MTKIRCINADNHTKYLTLNKEYIVRDVFHTLKNGKRVIDMVEILDDTGCYAVFYYDRFVPAF